jgi:hypothetical protein
MSGPSYERIVQGFRVGRDWVLGEQDRSRSGRERWLREWDLWAEGRRPLGDIAPRPPFASPPPDGASRRSAEVLPACKRVTPFTANSVPLNSSPYQHVSKLSTAPEGPTCAFGCTTGSASAGGGQVVPRARPVAQALP